MSRIVLFFPNPFSSTRDFGGVPLSLLAISRCLASEGYPIKIVTPHEYKNYAEVVLEESKDALCIGISAMAGYQIHDGLMMSTLIKKKYPKLPIIWGGWHPSILPDQTVSDPRIDIVVRGQAERTFAELVHALERNTPLDDISGLTLKRDSRIISTPERKPESLDNFPSIPYHLIDLEKYVFTSELGKRCVSYYSSYGCPHRCGFCVEKVVNKRRWVSQSAERVVEDMEMLVSKYQIDGIAVHDSNFFVDSSRVLRICELIMEKKLQVSWGCCNGRSDQLSKFDENMWTLLWKSGCRTVLIGVESGSQKTLDVMNKDITIEQTIKVIETTAKFNIKVYCSFLVGIPWSTDQNSCRDDVEEEFRITLDFMDKLLVISPRLRIMFFVYLPYPSSDLFEKAANLGLDLPNSLEGWSKYLMAAEDARNIIQHQKWITREQMLVTLMISSYIFFFLDPDSIGYVKKCAKNPITKLIGIMAFYVFKTVCGFRWRHRWFKMPIDFFFYNFLRCHLNIG